jgi:hypothetical protein
MKKGQKCPKFAFLAIGKESVNEMNFEALQSVVLGQGGALLVLLAWLVWALKEIRRLQRQCNRRTEDYIDLITEFSSVKIPARRRGESQDEDLTNNGV